MKQPLIPMRARFERFDEPCDITPRFGRQCKFDRMGVEKPDSPICICDSEQESKIPDDFDARKIMNFDASDFISGELSQRFADRFRFFHGKAAESNDRIFERVADEQVKFHSIDPIHL